jgi:hypothetical protein
MWGLARSKWKEDGNGERSEVKSATGKRLNGEWRWAWGGGKRDGTFSPFSFWPQLSPPPPLGLREGGEGGCLGGQVSTVKGKEGRWAVAVTADAPPFPPFPQVSQKGREREGQMRRSEEGTIGYGRKGKSKENVH